MNIATDNRDEVVRHRIKMIILIILSFAAMC